jgi:hypothetical protein
MAEHSTINENNETFTIQTYNGISVMKRNKDGYINATKLCRGGNKDFRTFLKTKRWSEIKACFEEENEGAHFNAAYELRKNYQKCQGQYINPKLIHFVAEYMSIKYAFTVRNITDTINSLVHVELHKNNLPDTPTNAEPILNKIEKSLKQKLLDEMKTIEDIDSYKYRDLQANYNALDDNDNFNIILYNKSLEESSDKMF